MNKAVKKTLKVGAIVLASLLVLLGASLVFVSYKGGDIAKKYIEEHDTELLGREITIGNIDLSLLKGQVTVDSVALKEADGVKDFVSFDTLYVDMDLFALLSNKIKLDHIHLYGAKFTVLQRDSIFNFTDIIKHFANDTTSSKDTAESETGSWKLFLSDIRLRDCGALYKDQVLNSQFNLNHINIDVPGLYFSDQATDVGLNLKFDNGGSLHAQMKYDMESSDFVIETQITDFDVACIKPYMRQGVRVGSLSGLLDVNAVMKGDFNHVMNFDLSGKSVAKNIRITDDKDRLVASVRRSSAELVRLNMNENVIHLGLVDGEAIASQFLIDAGGKDNISYFVASPEAAVRREQRDSIAATEPKDSVAMKEKNPLKFTIDKVDMRGLGMHMVDSSVATPFVYDVADFAVLADNVTLDKENDVSVSGRMGKTGSMTARWRGSLNSMMNQNIIATLTNVDLTEFTPYFSPIFAYSITGGHITLTSQNVIDNGKLKGTNQMSVLDCTVEKDKTVSNPEFKVPLKTALYVIKDKNGKIGIDLPVAGDINSPEFSYKKIVVKTLLNFLAKVGSSPVKSLAKAFGGADDFEKVAFDPTSSILSAEIYGQLNKVADIVRQKPELKVALTQNVNYCDAVNDMKLLLMKTDFYLNRHPEKTYTTLEPIDNDAIAKLSLKDSAFVSFVKSLDAEMSVEKVADSLYAGKAIEELVRRAELRKSAVCKYFEQQLDTLSSHVEAVNPPYGETVPCKGKSVHLFQLKEE